MTMLLELEMTTNALPDETNRQAFLDVFIKWFVNRSIFDQPMMEYAVYGNKSPLIYFNLPCSTPVPDDSCKSIFRCLESIRPVDLVYVTVEFVKVNLPVHRTKTEEWTLAEEALSDLESVDHTNLIKRFTFLRTNAHASCRVMSGTSNESYEDACKYHQMLQVIEPPRMVFGLNGPIMVGMGDRTIGYSCGNIKTTLKSVDPKSFK